MDTLTLLRLQIAWGADEALDVAPVNRLRPPGDGREQRQGQPPGAPPRAPLAPPGAGGPNEPASPRRSRLTDGAGATAPANAAGAANAAERAVAAAAQAATLEALRAAIAGFDGCALRDTAANLVFAAGDPEAGLLLIGDPPGEAEDRSGTPFAGADGALLDRMLASVGLSRDAILLAPLIPWRPPGGRPPNAAELAICLPFLHRLIRLAAPARIVIAGALASRSLLGNARRRALPTWTEAAIPGLDQPLPAVTMPAPGMVAHTPAARREAWAVLRLVRRTLNDDLAKT